jgi:hypothetical protein
MKNSSHIQLEKRRASRRSVLPLPCGGGLCPVQPALVAHVLNTLPDSLSRREELLRALAAGLPPGDEGAVWVRALQFHLQEHQRLRFDWPGEAGQP